MAYGQHYSPIVWGPGGTALNLASGTSVPIITTTESFTPTWNNLSVGDGTQGWQRARVGDLLHIQGSLTFGSTTSISGSVSMDNPIAATTISQVNGSLNIGGVYLYDSGGTANNEHSTVQVASNTLRPLALVGDPLNTTVPFTWATGDRISFDLWVKVDEWTAGA